MPALGAHVTSEEVSARLVLGEFATGYPVVTPCRVCTFAFRASVSWSRRGLAVALSPWPAACPRRSSAAVRCVGALSSVLPVPPRGVRALAARLFRLVCSSYSVTFGLYRRISTRADDEVFEGAAVSRPYTGRGRCCSLFSERCRCNTRSSGN